jgi:hypothetical protein
VRRVEEEEKLLGANFEEERVHEFESIGEAIAWV